jgi:hypothetical protein
MITAEFQRQERQALFLASGREQVADQGFQGWLSWVGNGVGWIGVKVG